MPRLLVTGDPPRWTPSRPSSSSVFLEPLRPVVVVVILSRPFFFTRDSLYPRQRVPLPPLPYHATATRRVSLTSSTSLSWVRGCVCNARNVLGTQDPRRQSITPSRSRRTRTLLSPYVNELLIFRASDFFVSFFFISLIRRALHRLPSVFRLSLLPRPLARHGLSNVCHYKAGINSSLLRSRG